MYDASRHAQNIDCVFFFFFGLQDSCLFLSSKRAFRTPDEPEIDCVDPTVPSNGLLGMCMVLKTAAKGTSNAVLALLS